MQKGKYEALQPVIIKAGQAVFFDQSIVHFSPPNFSNKIRIVTNTYFTHKSTEFRTYYWNKEQADNKVEVFAQDDNFMTDFEQFGENIRERPKVGKSLGFTDYNFPSIDKAYLESNFTKTNARQLIQQAKPLASSQSQKKSFFQRVKELITS